jgi:hypothetical protein
MKSYCPSPDCNENPLMALFAIKDCNAKLEKASKKKADC